MGYTHYYGLSEPVPEDEFMDFINDVELIIEHTSVPIADGVGEEEDNYECLKSGVVFNGLGEDACETFVFTNEKLELYCKTRRKPYDAVVTAVLICAKHHFGNIVHVGSDGNDLDWKEGRKLCQRALGFGELFTLLHGGSWRAEIGTAWFDGGGE